MGGGRTRRGFLSGAAGALGGVAIAGAVRSDEAQAGASAEATVSKKAEPLVEEGAFDVRFDGDSFMLQLDGQPTGWLSGVSGGFVSADVVDESIDSDYLVRKHIANIKYEDLMLSTPVGRNKPFFDWIAATWQQNFQRRSGAVLAVDTKFNVQAAGEFHNGIITEVAFPAMDAGAKDAAALKVKIAPEEIKFKKAAGSAALRRLPPGPTAHGFIKMDIGGAESDGLFMSKIDSFTIKQTVNESRNDKIPGKLEFPNLKVWIEPDAVEPWRAWHEDFVIKGNNTQAHEKKASLKFYDDSGFHLADVVFEGVGIFRLAIEKIEIAAKSNETVRLARADLYAETVSFKFGDTSAWK